MRTLIIIGLTVIITLAIVGGAGWFAFDYKRKQEKRRPRSAWSRQSAVNWWKSSVARGRLSLARASRSVPGCRLE